MDGINSDEALPLLTQTSSKFKSPRIEVLDILRGFIMIIMAVDHISIFIAHVHGSEAWSGETQYNDTFIDNLKFATRFATHICAPGFSYLMGIGMVFFTASRIRLGWAGWRIARHHATRALLLMCPCAGLEMVAFRLADYVFPELDTSPGVYFGTSVLFALSTSMLICGSLLVITFLLAEHYEWRYAPAGVFALFAALSFIISEAIIDKAAPDGVNWFVGILAVPGTYGHFGVTYCIFPWCGVCAMGCLMGLFLLARADHLRFAAGCVSVCTVVVFVLLREARSFGNLVNMPRKEDGLQFLDVVKYPPSLTYVMVTFSILHGLIVLFITLSKLEAKAFSSIFWNPLKVFGTSPLFYYVMHLWLGAPLGLIFDPKGLSYPLIYPFWIAVVLMLYPMCRMYGTFKASTPPESLWRFF